MTTTTITPHVPQRPRDEWAALDDPGLSRLQRAASASTVLHSTPPVALAKRARHRKPNRRRHVIARGSALFLLVAAFFAVTLTATTRTSTQAPAFYGLTPGQASQVATVLEAPAYQLAADVTGTPSQDYAACAAVYHFHHMNAIDYGGAHAAATERAWYHAAHLALSADPEMNRDIHRYLNSGRYWSLVAYDCNPDA